MEAVGCTYLGTHLALTLVVMMMMMMVVMVTAEGDYILPGVRTLQGRSKRQGTIVFPDDPMFASPARGPKPKPARGEETLELPEDMDLNALDLRSLSLLNTIDNITQFASLFGLGLPVKDEALDDFEITSRIRGTEGEVSELATMAMCKPELTTVELDLPIEPNTLFYPTCVRLEQCGGCCYGPLLTCRPKVTKVVKFQVLKTVVGASASSTTRRTRRRRRRRQAVPSYHEVEAIKHVQCECGCKQQAEDCNPAIHNYQESECACVCKSRDEKAKCERQKNDKYWDNDSCACYCRRAVDCSTGEFFSHNSCRCERLATRSGLFPDEIEAGVFDIARWRPFDRQGTRRRRPVRIPLID